MVPPTSDSPSPPGPSRHVMVAPGHRQARRREARATYGVVAMQARRSASWRASSAAPSTEGVEVDVDGDAPTSACTSSWSAASTSLRSPPTCRSRCATARRGRRSAAGRDQRARRGPEGLNVRTRRDRGHRGRAGRPRGGARRRSTTSTSIRCRRRHGDQPRAHRARRARRAAARATSTASPRWRPR